VTSASPIPADVLFASADDLDRLSGRTAQPSPGFCCPASTVEKQLETTRSDARRRRNLAVT